MLKYDRARKPKEFFMRTKHIVYLWLAKGNGEL